MNIARFVVRRPAVRVPEEIYGRVWMQAPPHPSRLTPHHVGWAYR